MPNSVRFYGESDFDFLELTQRQRSAAGVELLIRHETNGNINISSVITASEDEIRNLTQWLAGFWDECPPAILARGYLRFVYSHREHVGEGYYSVECDGKRVLTAYEQLGTSNGPRAEQVQALLN